MDEQRTAGGIGALNTGSGTMHIATAIGQQYNHLPVGTRAAAETAGPAAAPRRRVHVGILTVLPEEMRAIVRMLHRAGTCRTEQLRGGLQVYEAEIPAGAVVLSVVAMQTMDRGPLSAAVAYQALRRRYAPSVVLLAGIAGSLRDDVAIGDVVIGNEMIYHDAKRESSQGFRRRGRTHPISPVLRNRINFFFQANGPEFHLDAQITFKIFQGPIGSGDTVVTRAESEVRLWLREFHEKVLAIETEAAGVAQAFYEDLEDDSVLRGWLTVRGISDRADEAKGHRHHDLASERAALVVERLLPYLALTGAEQ